MYTLKNYKHNNYYDNICNIKIFKHDFQVDSSFMTFEGIQIQGGPKIMEKLSVRFSYKLQCAILFHFLIVLTLILYFIYRV